jgi:demethylmenaquinone methyltransferase/2-methoxy-6-polyprenyl-1,4-benzoquinol methylase
MFADDIRSFDRWARYYDLAMPGASTASLSAGLDAAERPVERLLDLAGGTGRAAVALDVPDRIVLDAAGGMLARARDRGLACLQGDARRLPLGTDSVDAVTIVDALHHVPDWEAVFAEVARVLAPGGVFVVAEFDPATLLGRVLVAGERAIGFDSQFATPASLVASLSAAGFEATVVEGGFGYTVAGVVPKQETE